MWESLSIHIRYDGRRCTVCAEEATSAGAGGAGKRRNEDDKSTRLLWTEIQWDPLFCAMGTHEKIQTDLSYILPAVTEMSPLPLSQRSDHLKRH